MFAGMTAYILYRKILGEIGKRYDASEADSITAMLFEFFAGINRSSVAREPEKMMDPETESRISSACERIVGGEPVQYVTGQAWFCGLPFLVGPGVLIPRPETEELVQELLQSAGKDPLRILDIGTGSGCIAISLKKALPDSQITAIDISNEALAIARENARRHGTEIKFLQTDFLKQAEQLLPETFDRIISNPPYIPLMERSSLDEHVREHEPSVALFVPDENPVLFYEKIAVYAQSHLSREGALFLEIHEPYAMAICHVLEENGFSCQILTDMFGKKRIVKAIHCL